MGKNRNKYAHLYKPLPILPYHVIELIIDNCDVITKTRFSISSKYFLNYIGDVTPIHIKQQQYFLNSLKYICENPKCAYFHMMIISKHGTLIVSDENNTDVYVYIMQRINGKQKTDTKYYKKSCIVKNIRRLFKTDKIWKTVNKSYNKFFNEYFENIYGVTIACGKQKPVDFNEWKDYLKQLKEMTI